MKVLLGCSNRPDAGAGIAVYVRELAGEFIRQGIEVHLASPPPQQEKWLNEMQIRHIPCHETTDPLKGAGHLVKYVDQHKIDGIINSDNSLLQSVAPGVTCPFISVGHFGSTIIASLACHQWQWCDYVVAISSDMQKRFVQRYRVPVTRCPVIHNGIKDRGHDGQYHRKDPATIRVVYAGGQNPFKGADIVLRTVLKKAELWKGMRLDWFGVSQSRYVPRLSGLAHVQARGHVPHEELLACLRNADVLLFPSRAEGCPMALLEAMSMGVVCIASDGEGAMRWLIENGRSGFICNLRTWDSQVMECLAYLRDTPVVLENMKRSARTRFLKEYDVALTVANFLTLLRQPTVNRAKLPERIDILKWHRPPRPSLPERIRFKFGWLQSAGTLQSRAIP